MRTEGNAWGAADEILKRIRAPSIPNRNFSITSFGAKPDADCTSAIAAAISAASAAGGGRIVVPDGVWQTGAITLKSRTELHVAKGATLKFSRDPNAYLPVVLTRHEGIELMNYAPFIYAYGQEDIAITGEGTLDGQADAEHWWNWAKRAPPGTVSDRQRLADMGEQGVPVAQRVFGAGKTIRPNFVQPYRCKNVLIEGLTIVASPMWEIHPVECTNVIVRGLNIRSLGPNNDGCDPESCRDVLIENCTFATGDDCIAIKSGRNADGRRLHAPTENVVIRNCRMMDGHGGFTLGSECTGGIRNVFMENCRMDSPHLDNAMRFKNNAMRGGTLENIFVRNITIGQVAGAVINVDYSYQEGPNGPFMPVFRNMVIENVTSQKSKRALNLQGYANAPLDGVTLRD
ncbi:MAG TPA: glycoside hydrolase family 28 protein, partial [Hyphomonadaceae bacterium]|nr:glycoside hydrolase family 28 protein [Hyphomonadaceae bacterium]